MLTCCGVRPVRDVLADADAEFLRMTAGRLLAERHTFESLREVIDRGHHGRHLGLGRLQGRSRSPHLLPEVAGLLLHHLQAMREHEDVTLATPWQTSAILGPARRSDVVFRVGLPLRDVDCHLLLRLMPLIGSHVRLLPVCRHFDRLISSVLGSW